MRATKKELVLAAAFMLLLPLVAEIVLRATDVQFGAELYTADPRTGWRLRSHAEGWVVQENRQYVRINSHGFRDRERSFEKPPNTFRIAILGNSWTEALQVPLDKTFP